MGRRQRLVSIQDDPVSPRAPPFTPGMMSFAGSGPDSRSSEMFFVMPDTPPHQVLSVASSQHPFKRLFLVSAPTKPVFQLRARARVCVCVCVRARVCAFLFFLFLEPSLSLKAISLPSPYFRLAGCWWFWHRSWRRSGATLGRRPSAGWRTRPRSRPWGASSATATCPRTARACSRSALSPRGELCFASMPDESSG